MQLVNKLTHFQQLLVIQAVRPDRLQSTFMNFASKALGLFFFLISFVISWGEDLSFLALLISEEIQFNYYFF